MNSAKLNVTPGKTTVCIYHEDCFDGFTAATIVHETLDNGNMHFIPMQYGQVPSFEELEPVFNGRDVFIVDFSIEPALAYELAKVAQKITIIDHHKAAAEEWAEYMAEHGPSKYIDAHFNQAKSGALLTYDFMKSHFPKAFEGTEDLEAICKVADDWDRWVFSMSDTKDIAEYFYTRNWTTRESFDSFKLWAKTLGCHETFRKDIAKTGRELMHAKVNNIKRNAENYCTLIDFDGYEVPIMMMTRENTSIAGDILGEMYPASPFVVLYRDDLKARRRYYSLRRRGAGPNLSEIAKRFGGGGHDRAASFSTSVFTAPVQKSSWWDETVRFIRHFKKFSFVLKEAKK